MSWRRIRKSLTEVLFPCKCHACGKIFRPPLLESFEDASMERDRASSFSDVMGTWLCAECLAGFAPVQSPLCSQCGVVFPTREGSDHLCGECISEPKHFSRARAAGIYDGPLMALIQCLKFKGMTGLARPLGGLLFEAFLKNWNPEDIDLVVPVPLHFRRLAGRGFNQAWLLISDWPDRFRSFEGADWGGTISYDILTRTRFTTPQTGLGKTERIANLKGAFRAADPNAVAGKRILLVDDVVTTGTTVNECARVLLESGARRVDVLSVARTL